MSYLVRHLLIAASVSGILFTTATSVFAKGSGEMLLRASWYGKQFNGRKMANGQRFNMFDPLTVAHKSWAFGTKLVVTNPATGRTCHAVVRDRGPYVSGRSLDFSYAAAKCLGFAQNGTARVRVRIVS